MVAFPAVIPVTKPAAGSIVATDRSALLHVPPARELLNVEKLPWHTVALPAIAPGSAFTVNVKPAIHPVGVVYLIIVVPADNPLTSPVGSTVATEGIVLLHVPAGVASLNVIVFPAQVEEIPVIASRGLTVTIVVAIHPEVVV